MFVSTSLLKIANSGSLRPLSFVSILQQGPQTSPQSACVSFPALAFQSPCTTRMSFLVLGLWFPGFAGRSGHCPDVGAQQRQSKSYH